MLVPKSQSFDLQKIWLAQQMIEVGAQCVGCQFGVQARAQPPIVNWRIGQLACLDSGRGRLPGQTPSLRRARGKLARRWERFNPSIVQNSLDITSNHGLTAISNGPALLPPQYAGPG